MDLSLIYQPISRELMLVEEELKKQLNRIIRSQSSQNQKFINQIISYLFKVPGKLLRPALVLLCGKAVGNLEAESSEQLINLATAVEFLHSASLIHDDIIDESGLRRHQITLNKQFGNQIAILVGDIFYSQFFSIIIDLKTSNTKLREKLLRFFCDTTKKLCFGEIYEYKILQYGKNPSLSEYLEIIENKTASLFSVSCMGGGLLNGADEQITTALADYGMFLGLAFQIVDDHIDGDSIFNSEINMINKAKEYADKAKKVIENLPESPIKYKLLNLPDYVMERAKVKNRET
ncbi:MAG: polyprenyl synthetase family protein [Spirochaetes bacterium]|nr:polyprenyl synthetase family protein [Spirochaetota bacterium]